MEKLAEHYYSQTCPTPTMARSIPNGSWHCRVTSLPFQAIGIAAFSTTNSTEFVSVVGRGSQDWSEALSLRFVKTEELFHIIVLYMLDRNMSDGRKRLSGSEYEKRRALKEDNDKKQKDALQRYFKPKRAAARKVDEHSTVTTAYSSNAEGGPSTTCSTDFVWTQDLLCVESSKIGTSGITEIWRPDWENTEGTSAEVLTTAEGIEGEPELEDTIDSDQGSWPQIITDCIRTTLIMRGSPERIKEAEECPKNADNRCFSSVHYSYSLKNLEEADTHWLVYSKSKDAVFCLCCKLFSSSTVKISKNCTSDWRHLASYLQSHEKSTEHLNSHKKWIVFSEGLKTSRTVDARHQRLLNTESEHWKNVLERLIAIIHFLGRQCLPLRGRTDILFQPDNGNFLKVSELFGKFDTVMMEHLHSQSKYYSIFVDCKPDISKVEQMAVVLHFVQETGLDGVYDVRIREHFLGFLPVSDSSSSSLRQVVLKFLEDKINPVV
ncbi:uncharacterized protein LOC126298314 [Schistocerca gregaria]|uniref:uncharacterized protein LOC126298314 n=1 Tax=Schistocerca gregaria TaxID=7010 RepID=UPI00211E191D|nr:uncharacterized protein LOC126298314 [Schistocerca gregaria]